MNITKWQNPFLNELLNIRKTFKDLIDDDFLKREPNNSHMPLIEVYEKDDKVFVEAGLPGMKKDDISIEIDDGILKISGKVEENKEKKGDGYFYTERKYGSFARRFEVPATLKEEDVTAEYKDGVLMVNFPKTQKNKEVKKIAVK